MIARKELRHRDDVKYDKICPVELDAPVRIIKYVNRTTNQVFVRDRSGCTITVEPSPTWDRLEDEFYVVVEIWNSARTGVTYENGPMIDPNSGLSGMALRSRNIYSVSLAEIKQIGKFHSDEIGVTISVDRQRIPTREDFDAVPQINRDDCDSEPLQTEVRIVDSKNPGSQYFVVNGGEVFRILSVASSDANDFKEGVYFMSSRDSDRGERCVRMDIKECMYDPKNVDRVGITLYTSVEAARLHGTISGFVEDYKRRLEELDAAKRKRDIDALAAANKLKQEQEAQKAKQASEWWGVPAKIISSIAGLVGSVFALTKLFLR